MNAENISYTFNCETIVQYFHAFQIHLVCWLYIFSKSKDVAIDTLLHESSEI